jgi:hypothetical protein
MSDKTSHRRRARQNRAKQARAGIVVVCNVEQDCTPDDLGERDKLYTAVGLLTGLSRDELDELGGFDGTDLRVVK